MLLVSDQRLHVTYGIQTISFDSRECGEAAANVSVVFYGDAGSGLVLASARRFYNMCWGRGLPSSGKLNKIEKST